MAETALVTGASSGIGEQFARQLAERGYELVLVARRRDRLERIAAELPTRAHVVECDLGSEAASLPEEVGKLGVSIDLLVNNAGFGTYGRFQEIDEGRDAEMVRVNCEAVVILTRAFLPGMVERGRGGVIVVASTSGMQPLPYTATYSASKAFALTFTEALHQELRGTGVRALAVSPGPVPTEWQRITGLERHVPAAPGRLAGTIEADQVVAEALDAFDRDSRSLIPGRTFRWIMRLTRAPRPIQLRVAERMYRPRD